MKSIGIDIGTTSISAVVMDAAGDRVERAFTITNPGFLPSEQPWERIQSPDAIIASAKGLLDDILSDTPDAEAVGLTGQMHGIVYLDGEGRAVSPLMTWQDGRGSLPDERGESVCEAVARRFGIKAYPGYGLMTHLANVRMGRVPDGARTVATIMDLLGMALTGRKKPILHSSDAASLGLYDLRAHRWREDIFAALGGDCALLPETANRFEVIGSYRGIPVGIAIGDNQASFMGSVRDGDGELLVNMGTGGQISLLSDRILDAEDIETRPFNEDSYLVVGSLLCGGRAYATLARFMADCARAFGCAQPDAYAAMARLLEEAPQADPMAVDTRFAGTREHPGLRGSITNLTTDNFTPAGLTRGVLTGMAQELYSHYRTMEDALGVKRSRIIASGNGMRRNAPLQRITSELFGMPLELSRQTEEAACGAAISGLVAIGERTWEDAVGLQ